MFHRACHNRICSERGVTRLVLLLSIIAAVLAAAVLGVPLWHYFADRSGAYGCGAALATANDQLKIAYLGCGGDMTAADAKEEVTRAMDGWDDLCPGGGDCYIVAAEGEDVPYRVVCALHDSDVEEAVLLNARSALVQTAAQLRTADAGGDIPVTVNSDGLSAVYDPSETVIRPTAKELRRAGGALISYNTEDGAVAWFCYADEDRVCVWDAETAGYNGFSYGWTVRYA